MNPLNRDNCSLTSEGLTLRELYALCLPNSCCWACSHLACFLEWWLCPLKKSSRWIHWVHDMVSVQAICSTEDRRMTWDEGAEQREDRKWQVYEREGKWEEENLGERKSRRGKWVRKEVWEEGSQGKEEVRKRSSTTLQKAYNVPSSRFYRPYLFYVYNKLIR